MTGVEDLRQVQKEVKRSISTLVRRREVGEHNPAVKNVTHHCFLGSTQARSISNRKIRIPLILRIPLRNLRPGFDIEQSRGYEEVRGLLHCGHHFSRGSGYQRPEKVRRNHAAEIHSLPPM
uniref:Uncharacterized protein n=1 Tax=Compsopogon caeruleus TaxID=31354 RepID=A0A6T6C5Y8_9RHOD|mmetsp:Transcript_3539/g.6701  ORF Transcript_3539/g.6701 Transcript_3539/m.6701 type:complete len:121 (+) Transcript_3539:583-945(+)